MMGAAEMTANKRRAVFLDRDGTVIVDAGHAEKPGQVSLIPGAAKALADLQRRGFALVLVSNQAEIGRAFVTPEEASSVHQRCVQMLAEQGVRLDGAYYCPHAPEEQCNCRKPSPELICHAARELNLSIRESVMVGDKLSDAEAGRRAGCRTVLLKADSSLDGHGYDADYVASDWAQVVAHILNGAPRNRRPSPSDQPRGLFQRFEGKRVLVVGDVMLDEYLWGSVTRVSPEAPVPVVEMQKNTYVPGGAANAAVNVASLGGEAVLCGVVGSDPQAEHLRTSCRQRGVEALSLVEDSVRATTTKTRIMAHGQQLVRLDIENRQPLSTDVENHLLESSAVDLAHADCCILSDYDKGVVSPRVADVLLARCRDAGKPVVVDPKGADYRKYRGASLVTPNLTETQLATGIQIADEQTLLKAAHRLLSLLPGSSILITRGADGMSLFRPDGERVDFPATARNVFDVTGAGDAVVGTLAIALASRLPIERSIALANLAGGIAVAKVGTCPVTIEELRRAANAALDSPGEPCSASTAAPPIQ